ncbi:hypothetical protein Dsin_022372 [Dipteronia sinensis]|uniref:RNase H type-1 domain-containing protein n=1 Tax=Dipteronia sinensis TaxID=43782 RepID=A0AAE0E132_9ROSI|nr:hypothetical protein Dsin_022372 [Dipteronia sinensis]
MNTFKFNVDGSVRGNPRQAGIGGVLRDSNGNVVCPFSYFVGTMDSNAVEITAIHTAIEICSSAPSHYGQVVSIVSDSKMAVSWINNEDFGSLEQVRMISFIRVQLKSLDGLKVVHTSRMFNSFVDNLAKMGSGSNGDFLHWM